MNIRIDSIKDNSITISWDKAEGADSYCLKWADTDHGTTKFREVCVTSEQTAVFKRSTHIKYTFLVQNVL